MNTHHRINDRSYRYLNAAMEEQRVSAWGNARLIEHEFAPRPTFRMGFDEHVRAFREAVSRRIGRRYHRDEAFRAAYDARELQARSMPMPPWKEPLHDA